MGQQDILDDRAKREPGLEMTPQPASLVKKKRL